VRRTVLTALVATGLLAAGCSSGQPTPTVTVTRTVTVAPRPSAASAAAASAAPSVAYSCRLGYVNEDGDTSVLLPLAEKYSSGYASAFLIKFTNTGHQDVTLHNVTEESVSQTGQEIDSQTVGESSPVNPGNLPFLLAPGESITMLAEFGSFPSTVQVSNATYLHSTCRVTGWT